MRKTKLHSLLNLMYECPYIDTNVGNSLFANSRKQLHLLMQDGLVESFDGLAHHLMVRKGYRLTEEGIDRVQSLQRTLDNSGITSADEDYPNGTLYTSGYPTMHKGFQRSGMTHFQNLFLTYLWLQLRWYKPQPFSLLWDNVRARESYPILGNPDMIFFRQVDFVKKRFERLVIFELEITEKSDAKIFERINSLSQNEYAAIIVVSSSIKLLKDYAVTVRKGIPISNYFNNRKTFNSKFLNLQEFEKRVWFLEWDSTSYSIRDSGINKAIIKRCDHPDFDLLGTLLYDKDGREISGPIPHDRWKGPYEMALGELLELCK